MAKALHKTRKYGTFTLLCSSVLIILVFSIAKPELYDAVAKRAESLWTAIVGLLTFFGFVVGGVIKNPPKSFSKFLENGFLQIAVLELFLFSAGMTGFAIWTSRSAEVELKLLSGQTFPQIRVLVESREGSRERDTVFAPSPAPLRRKPGTYTFKIVEPEYEPFASGDVVLKPGRRETLSLNDRRMSGTLVVNSKPQGAEIWIDGSFTSKKTPETLKDLPRRRLKLRLVKDPEFAPHEQEVDLSSRSEVNLAAIELQRMYRMRFVCADNDTRWSILGHEYVGSAELWLRAGQYSVTFVRPDGTRGTKTVSVRANARVPIL